MFDGLDWAQLPVDRSPVVRISAIFEEVSQLRWFFGLLQWVDTSEELLEPFDFKQAPARKNLVRSGPCIRSVDTISDERATRAQPLGAAASRGELSLKRRQLDQL